MAVITTNSPNKRISLVLEKQIETPKLSHFKFNYTDRKMPPNEIETVARGKSVGELFKSQKNLKVFLNFV